MLNPDLDSPYEYRVKILVEVLSELPPSPAPTYDNSLSPSPAPFPYPLLHNCRRATLEEGSWNGRASARSRMSNERAMLLMLSVDVSSDNFLAG